MALRSDAITTPARAASFIGITLNSTNQAKLELLINSVTSFIQNYIGYNPKKSERTEIIDTDRSESFSVSATPIDPNAAFTLQRRDSSLNEDEWATVATEYYHVEHDTGIIYAAQGWGFPRMRQGIRVTYTAGYDYDNSSTFLGDTEGADIELAAWMLLAGVWNRGSTGGGIQSERIGDYQIVYKRGMMENEEVSALLDQYSSITFAGPLTPLQM